MSLSVDVWMGWTSKAWSHTGGRALGEGCRLGVRVSSDKAQLAQAELQQEARPGASLKDGVWDLADPDLQGHCSSAPSPQRPAPPPTSNKVPMSTNDVAWAGKKGCPPLPTTAPSTGRNPKPAAHWISSVPDLVKPQPLPGSSSHICPSRGLPRVRGCPLHKRGGLSASFQGATHPTLWSSHCEVDAASSPFTSGTSSPHRPPVPAEPHSCPARQPL